MYQQCCYEEKGTFDFGEMEIIADYIQKGSPQYWQTVISLFLGSIAAFGAEYCVQPIIPILARDFAISPSVASLAMSCGTGGMALAMILIANLAGMLHRKRMMSIALLASAVLMILMAFSSGFCAILFLRFLQGMFLAAFPSMVIAYINEEFNPKIVGLVVGIYISGTSVGGLMGRLMLSTLVDFFSWRIGLVALAVLYLFIGLWFHFSLAKSRRHVPSKTWSAGFLTVLCQAVRNKKLLQICLIAFTVCGSFVAMYNYISFPLLASPYNLSQTAVGAVFSIYLVGTVSSTFMGGMSDQYGNGKVLILSLGIMLIGALSTLFFPLVVKIAGLAVFTFGFFGAHATASGWAGKSCYFSIPVPVCSVPSVEYFWHSMTGQA